MTLHLNGDGLLPPGRHQASIVEVRELFVDSAPHREHRATLMSAFEIWLQQIALLIPSGSLWVDGGFVTHKRNPPQDIDVVLRCRDSEVNALTETQQVKFESLLTSQGDSGRVQPMGGLVDAYFSPRSEPDRTAYWVNLWSSVKATDGSIVPGLEKGFVEVKL